MKSRLKSPFLSQEYETISKFIYSYSIYYSIYLFKCCKSANIILYRLFLIILIPKINTINNLYLYVNILHVKYIYIYVFIMYIYILKLQVSRASSFVNIHTSTSSFIELCRSVFLLFLGLLAKIKCRSVFLSLFPLLFPYEAYLDLFFLNHPPMKFQYHIPTMYLFTYLIHICALYIKIRFFWSP